jgi:hypothetical protein
VAAARLDRHFPPAELTARRCLREPSRNERSTLVAHIPRERDYAYHDSASAVGQLEHHFARTASSALSDTKMPRRTTSHSCAS